MKASVIALHGFLGRSQDWQPLLAHWPVDRSAGHRVWCPQLLSPTTAYGPDFNLPVWTTLFNAAVAALTPAPRILIGYSMGGRLALHAALARPELYSAMIVLSAHPGIADPVEQQQRRSWDRSWAERCLQLPWGELMRQWNAQTVFAGSGPAPQRLAIDYDRQRLADALLHFSPSRHAFSHEQLARLELPQLWLTGERDSKYRALADELMQRGVIPQAASLPGLGHRLLPHGAHVAAQIQNFLHTAAAVA